MLYGDRSVAQATNNTMAFVPATQFIINENNEVVPLTTFTNPFSTDPESEQALHTMQMGLYAGFRCRLIGAFSLLLDYARTINSVTVEDNMFNHQELLNTFSLGLSWQFD